MSEFCKGVVSGTYERYLFNTRSQAANEGIGVNYAALLRIAENCKFGNIEQSLMKDRIVVGVRDPALRKRLLYKKKLILQKCFEMARSFEATSARLQSMFCTALSDADVNFIHKGKGRRRQKPKPKHSPSSGADAAPWKAGSPNGATSGRHNRDSRCYYCGRQNHPRKDCPASELVCHKCNQSRFYQVVCKSKSVCEISEYSEDEGFVGMVDGGTKQWFTTVKVDGKPIEFRLGEMPDDYSISLEETAEPFSVTYPRRIPLPLMDKVKVDDYSISLKETAEPFSVAYPRRIPLPFMDKVKVELGVIQPITKLTDWCAPIIIVLKANSEKV